MNKIAVVEDNPYNRLLIRTILGEQCVTKSMVAETVLLDASRALLNGSG